MHSKQQLTEAVATRYFKATKKEKTQIFEEFCKNTDYERKYAIKKLIKQFLYPKEHGVEKQKRKKLSKYMLIKASLKELWKISDYASAVRLHGILPELVAKGLYYQGIHPNQE